MRVSPGVESRAHSATPSQTPARGPKPGGDVDRGRSTRLGLRCRGGKSHHVTEGVCAPQEEETAPLGCPPGQVSTLEKVAGALHPQVVAFAAPAH